MGVRVDIVILRIARGARVHVISIIIVVLLLHLTGRLALDQVSLIIYSFLHTLLRWELSLDVFATHVQLICIVSFDL